MWVIKVGDDKTLESEDYFNGSGTLTNSSDIIESGIYENVKIIGESETIGFQKADISVSTFFNGEKDVTSITLTKYLESTENKLSLLASLTLDDQQSIKNRTLFDDWSGDSVDYKKDISKVNHAGSLWKCITSHTSQPDWAPGVAPSLWTRMDDPSIEWPDWVQPVGSTDAYSKGDKVSHNGKHWVSTVEGEHTNTWEPGVFGWDEVSEQSAETE